VPAAFTAKAANGRCSGVEWQACALLKTGILPGFFMQITGCSAWLPQCVHFAAGINPERSRMQYLANTRTWWKNPPKSRCCESSEICSLVDMGLDACG